MSLWTLLLPSRLFLSEADIFLRDYLRTHPETAKKQREGLQLWWEKQEIADGDQNSDSD